MAQTSALFDGWGVIYDAAKRLPSSRTTNAIALASFQRRVCIGWHLKDIIDRQKHDDVLAQIEAKKIRYQRPKAKGK